VGTHPDRITRDQFYGIELKADFGSDSKETLASDFGDRTPRHAPCPKDREVSDTYIFVDNEIQRIAYPSVRGGHGLR
jgi:hypothetical protein